MTREEILAMKAGPELNKLVAEQVFDKKVITVKYLSGYSLDDESENYEECYATVFQDGKTFLYADYTPEFAVRVNLLEDYSRDISAAWQVLEKAGLAIFRLNNGDWVCCKANYIYHLEITQDHYADRNLIICREAPEAICKAALMAIAK